MVKSVLHANIRFFEENTQGRIINRFSKDIATLDQMVFQVLEVIDRMVSCVFSLALVVMIVPWLLILVAASFYYLYGLRKKTIYVSRDTMRLKATLTSPINSLIKDAINGLPTLRCLGKKDFFMQLLFKMTDMQTRSFITSNAGNRWTAIRIDFQAFLIGTVFAAITIFYGSPENPAQLAMMAIGFQMALSVTRQVDLAIRMSISVETSMTTVQRLFSFVDVT